MTISADLHDLTTNKITLRNMRFNDIKQEFIDSHIHYKNILREYITDYSPERSAFVESFKTSNTQYHLTLQFSYGTSEAKVKKILREFITALNIRVYNDRFKNGKNHIRGYAVMEKTYAKDTFHFHILLSQNEYYPAKTLLKTWIEKTVKHFESKDSRNYITCFKLQRYYERGSSDLEHYLTKNFEFYDSKKASQTIAPLGENGPEFG